MGKKIKKNLHFCGHRGEILDNDVITSSHLCASRNASSQPTADCWRHSITAAITPVCISQWKILWTLTHLQTNYILGQGHKMTLYLNKYLYQMYINVYILFYINNNKIDRAFIAISIYFFLLHLQLFPNSCNI